MSLQKITPERCNSRVYALTIFLSLCFFALTFYLRSSTNCLGTPFILTFLGVIAFSFVSQRWETLILLLLVMTSTVFEMMEFPTIPINIGDLFLSDVLIIFLIVSRLLKKVTVNITLIPKPMGYPVIAFIILGVFSFLYAIFCYNVSTVRAGIEMRDIFYFTLFFLVIYYVRDARQLKTLILGMGIVAGLVAILLLVQYALGYEHSILGGRVEVLDTAGQRFGKVTRVLAPGTSVMFFFLIMAISMYILKGIRRKAGLLLLIFISILVVGLILTFARSLWIGALFAVLFICLAGRRRISTYPRITILLVGASLGYILILQTKALNTTLIRDAIMLRYQSILKARSNFHDDTLYVRYMESRYALMKIIEHPFLGIGLGNSYRPRIFGNVSYEEIVDGTMVHIGYLAVQMKMGIGGTIILLWMMVLFFSRALRRWKLVKDNLFQTVVLGGAACMLALAILNLGPSPFLVLSWIAPMGVCMGIIEKIYQLEGIA
jgi:hypothetical protein